MIVVEYISFILAILLLRYIKIKALSVPHGQHGVYLPDVVPHLVDDLLQVTVLQHELLGELLVLLERLPGTSNINRNRLIEC